MKQISHLLRVIITVSVIIFASSAFAGTATFTYDSVGRLVSAAEGNVTIDYTYDKVGNHLELDVTILEPDVTILEPDVSASPSTIDFGGVAQNTTSSATELTISNAGVA